MLRPALVVALLVILAPSAAFTVPATTRAPFTARAAPDASSSEAAEVMAAPVVAPTAEARRGIVRSEAFNTLQNRLHSEVVAESEAAGALENPVATTGKSALRMVGLTLALWGPLYFGWETLEVQAPATATEVRQTVTKGECFFAASLVLAACVWRLLQILSGGSPGVVCSVVVSMLFWL